MSVINSKAEKRHVKLMREWIFKTMRYWTSILKLWRANTSCMFDFCCCCLGCSKSCLCGLATSSTTYYATNSDFEVPCLSPSISLTYIHFELFLFLWENSKIYEIYTTHMRTFFIVFYLWYYPKIKWWLIGLVGFWFLEDELRRRTHRRSWMFCNMGHDASIIMNDCFLIALELKHGVTAFSWWLLCSKLLPHRIEIKMRGENDWQH